MPVNESNTIQYTVTTTRVADGTTLDQKSTEQVVAKKQGGMVRGQGAAIRGTKFKGVF